MDIIKEKRSLKMNKKMTIIGKYHGVPVYKVTLPEYINNRYYKSDSSVIYLINGDMIRENMIIGTFDGNFVEEYDFYERAVYYTIPKFEIEKEKKEKETTFVPTGNFKGKSVEETLAEVYDIDYFSGMIDIDSFLATGNTYDIGAGEVAEAIQRSLRD